MSAFVSNIRYRGGTLSFRKAPRCRYHISICEGTGANGDGRNVLFYSEVPKDAIKPGDPDIQIRLERLTEWNPRVSLRAGRKYIASIFAEGPDKTSKGRRVDSMVQFEFKIQPADAKKIRARFPSLQTSKPATRNKPMGETKIEVTAIPVQRNPVIVRSRFRFIVIGMIISAFLA
jgi:hypothetical protein